MATGEDREGGQEGRGEGVGQGTREKTGVSRPCWERGEWCLRRAAYPEPSGAHTQAAEWRPTPTSLLLSPSRGQAVPHTAQHPLKSTRQNGSACSRQASSRVKQCGAFRAPRSLHCQDFHTCPRSCRSCHQLLGKSRDLPEPPCPKPLDYDTFSAGPAHIKGTWPQLACPSLLLCPHSFLMPLPCGPPANRKLLKNKAPPPLPVGLSLA